MNTQIFNNPSEKTFTIQIKESDTYIRDGLTVGEHTVKLHALQEHSPTTRLLHIDGTYEYHMQIEKFLKLNIINIINVFGGKLKNKNSKKKNSKKNNSKKKNVNNYKKTKKKKLKKIKYKKNKTKRRK